MTPRLEFRELTPAQVRAYETALTSSHRISARVVVYDQNEDLVGPLEANIVSGQVDADLSQTISKTLSLDLQDSSSKLSLDQIGPVSADNFIGVDYCVYVDSLASWVDVPVFYGPVTLFSRDRSTAHLEAQSKEALLLPPIRYFKSDNPSANKLGQFVRGMLQAQGETKFRLPDNLPTIPKRYEFTRVGDDGLWPYMQRVVDDFNRQLYYDTEGYVRVRRWRSTHDAWVFGDELLSDPSVSYDLTDSRNEIRVYGADKKGRDVLKAVATLGDSHPLSPVSLARNGVKRVMVEHVKTGRENLTSSEARTMAKRKLRLMSDGALSVEFEALPIPHLELGDHCRVKSDVVNLPFVLSAYSLPLTVGSGMSIGWTKPVSWKKLRRYT